MLRLCTVGCLSLFFKFFEFDRGSADHGRMVRMEPAFPCNATQLGGGVCETRNNKEVAKTHPRSNKETAKMWQRNNKDGAKKQAGNKKHPRCSKEAAKKQAKT